MSDQRILVLGGGYTGLASAIRTAGRTRGHGGRVTLVNGTDRFTERLRLHQTATGQELADLRISKMVRGTGIEFVQGWVTAIDADAREVRVHTPDGHHILPYDVLVYALGGVPDRGSVPGVVEHAFALSGRDEATRFAARLAEIKPYGGTVTVVGGGLTGIEAAAEVAESHPELRVTLLSREVPGAMMGAKARGYLHAALARLGVEVRTGVSVEKLLPDGVELASSESVPSDACLWAAGVLVSPLACEAGLTVDERGRIVVDETMRSVSHPEVYGVGDAAAVPQPYGIMHGTCQGGIPTAAHAADSIARRLRGRRAKPFRFGYIHQPVSIGRRDAVIQFTHPDDTPRRFYLTGRWAVAYKEFVSSSPWPTYRLMKHLPAALVWPHGGRRHDPRLKRRIPAEAP